MTAFCVLGVPKQKIEDIVTRRVMAMERRLKTPPRRGSTERRMAKVRAALHAKPPREVISAEFCAPQFCRDFIELAKRYEFGFFAIARRGDRAAGERAWEVYEEINDE